MRAASSAAAAAASAEVDENSGNAVPVVLDRHAALGNEASRLEAEQVRSLSSSVRCVVSSADLHRVKVFRRHSSSK